MECNREIDEDPTAVNRDGEEVGTEVLSFLAPFIHDSFCFKGGSWKDRAYWLDPSQRRYLPEYMATNYIGFRCATDKLGQMSYSKRRKEGVKAK